MNRATYPLGYLLSHHLTIWLPTMLSFESIKIQASKTLSWSLRIKSWNRDHATFSTAIRAIANNIIT